MIAPSVLPGRAFQRIDRVSRCLFSWRAADFSLDAITGHAGTLTRASAGGSVIGRNGLLRTPVHSQPRFQMEDLDGDGVRETPTLLLEQGRTNLLPYSEDFTQWASSGVTITGGATDPWGGTAASQIASTATNGTAYHSVAFTGDGTKAYSIFVKQGTSDVVTFGIYDDTVATWRVRVSVTWPDGVATASDDTVSGEVIKLEALAGGWSRLLFQVPNVIAANSNSFRFYPSGLGNPSGTDAYFIGAQAEDASWPSSYNKTAGATVARAVEACSWPFEALPCALTIYSRFLESGTIDVTSAGNVFLGSASGAGPFLATILGGPGYSVAYNTGASAQGTAALAAPAIGQLVEHAAVLNADGSLSFSQSLDGGAISTATNTTPLALPSAWSAATVVLNQNGTSLVGLTRMLEVKIAAGVRTMQEMREVL